MKLEKDGIFYITEISKSVYFTVFIWLQFMAFATIIMTDLGHGQDDIESYSNSKVVFVSQFSGTDQLSCIYHQEDHITRDSNMAPSNSFPCKSVDFAYRESLKRITNITEVLTIRFLDHIYHLNQTLNINTHNEKLKLLQINGKESTRTVLSAHFSEGKANFRIACEAAEPPCGFYKVALFNLVFEHFGPRLPAAVVLWNIPHINILHCTFHKNNCSGINALDSGATIIKSTFVDNNNNVNFIIPRHHQGPIFTFPDSNISSGGALGIVFGDASDTSITVRDCDFVRNTAVRKENDTAFVPHSPNNTMYYRIGAGILIVFARYSFRNTVFLQSNYVMLNRAFSGVGLSVITQDYALKNSVRVIDSIFYHNEAYETSAGVLFVSWDYSTRNLFSMSSCKVINNTAPISAGFKGVFHSLDYYASKFPASQFIRISRCVFCSNNARTASGIHLIYALPNSFKLTGSYEIENTTVCNHVTSENMHLVETGGSPTAYGGAVLTNRVDISFEGDNFIHGNKGGSALYASNSEIRIKDRASLTFTGNMAQSSGGAMNLADVSHLVLHPGSSLKFKGNYARIYGGAIAVQTLGIPELIYKFNPTCFLQYSDASVPPSKWKVKIKFIKNGAGLKGAAIYINTLTSCLWSDKRPHVSFQDALRWNRKTFIYKDNYLTLDNRENSTKDHRRPVILTPDVDIATDTSSFILNGPKTVEAAPGEEVPFSLIAKDELGNPVYSVPIANNFAVYPNLTISTDYIRLDRKYYIISPTIHEEPTLSYSVDYDKYRLLDSQDDTKHQILFVDSYSSFLSDAEMFIKPVPCRPGFTFDKELRKCVCEIERDAILRCEGPKVYLYKGYVANVSDNKLVLYFCPNNYCKCKSDGPDILGCEYDYKNPDMQCAPGREGLLCGACRKGLTVSLRGAQCIKCDNRLKTIVILVAVIVLIVTFCVLIVVLNPSFSTKMRGVLFFCQVLPYIVNPYDPSGKIVLTISSLVNLAGPARIPVDGCLIDGINNLEVISIGYLFPVVIFVVLGVTYLLARAYVINFHRDSPFESFWILMVAIYVMLSEVSLLFHFCVPLAGKKIFFYDGTIECYQGQHLFLMVIATMVLLIFIIPPPILVLLICFGYFRVDPQIVDALTKGLRRPFRWWWATDLFRRLFFVSIYVFIPSWTAKQIAFIVASLFALVLHAQCQPYISWMANVGETFLLSILTTLATLREIDDDKFRNTASAVALIIANLYVLACVLYLAINFIRSRCHRKGYSRITQMPDDDEGPDSRPLSPPGRRYTTPTRVLGIKPDL